MPGMMVHTYNPSTQEVEARGIVQGQPGLQTKTLSKKKNLAHNHNFWLLIQKINTAF
jgi:hypothetical protein